MRLGPWTSAGRSSSFLNCCDTSIESDFGFLLSSSTPILRAELLAWRMRSFLWVSPRAPVRQLSFAVLKRLEPCYAWRAISDVSSRTLCRRSCRHLAYSPHPQPNWLECPL